ncbi:MAG: ribonuclease H-like domain-containing protein [Conexivisphaerales archaeon]
MNENGILYSRKTLLGLYQGTLIDFETTGVIGVDPSCEVITLGYLTQNQLVVLQRKSFEKHGYYNELKKLLNALPKPFYSYNYEFEMKVMKEELGMQVNDSDFYDIMKPYKEMAETRRMKWPKLDELISEPEDYFGEGKVSGKDVPELWYAYLQSGDESILDAIAQHCFSDVLREMVLLIRGI